MYIEALVLKKILPALIFLKYHYLLEIHSFDGYMIYLTVFFFVFIFLEFVELPRHRDYFVSKFRKVFDITIIFSFNNFYWFLFELTSLSLSLFIPHNTYFLFSYWLMFCFRMSICFFFSALISLEIILHSICFW